MKRKRIRWRALFRALGEKNIRTKYDVIAQWPLIDKFLRDERLDVRAEQLFADPAKQRLSALCYVRHREQVLMLRRRKPPFVDHWTAPGGKLERWEQPREAIVREVREETGLTIREPRLRLIASETGGEHYNWLVFFFTAQPETKGVAKDLWAGPRCMREGVLDWLPVRSLSGAKIPGVERLLLPYVLTEDDGPPHFARICFDDNNDVIRCDVKPLQLLNSAT